MNISFKAKEIGLGYKVIVIIEGEYFEKRTSFDTMEAANDCIARMENALIDKAIISESRNEELAYRLIRRRARNMLESCTDQELGQYVQGVVDMQSEIFGEMGKR